MVSIEALKMEFSAKPILDNITFLINRKDRIALIGKNGAGKTTLLRLIAGEMEPTAGHISRDKELNIGYLPQHMIHAEGTTVREEVDKVRDKEDPKTVGLMEKTLLGLGFVRSDLDRPCSEFSGGWRMRIELAKILLGKPDLLLLDEPTNHLDIESIQWLEQWLLSCGSAVVLVSHDKAFMDNVANRTIEISLGHIYDYQVGYSEFVELRKERHEQQVRAYENQQKMIQDTEDFIERFRYKPTKSVQVQSRIKQLAKLERLEVDVEDTRRLRLRFPPAPRRNGEGKTTLVRCIMNELTDYTGSLKLGHNVKIGYFAQNQASLLDGDATVFDTIDRVAVGDIRTRIKDILGAFMFGGEESEKRVRFLSGGEKSRLAMIRLLLEPVNLLILDEPTNHLDIPSKDVLKDAIRDFDGTVICVSHDRDFLDGLVDKVYEFGEGKVREHIGGIYDWLRYKKAQVEGTLDNHRAIEQALKASGGAKSSSGSSSSSSSSGSSGSKGAQDYAAQKAKAAELRKAEKAVHEAETDIEQYEAQIAEMESQMNSDPSQQTAENFEIYNNLKRHLEQRMYEWEILAEQLETMRVDS